MDERCFFGDRFVLDQWGCHAGGLGSVCPVALGVCVVAWFEIRHRVGADFAVGVGDATPALGTARMNRLIEAGLMFGNMVHVTSPVWVARYNRALKRLTGRETTLSDFYIDISGFSPEVADDLDDPLYLNPQGVNRMFILLTPDQKRAPLLDAKFSMTRMILRAFIEENEAQLFALTTADAVAGEMLNSVFSAHHPRELLGIHQIEIEADTPSDTLAQAGALSSKIDAFLSSDDSWRDDVLISEMIGLAKQTGDVVRNPVQLTGLVQKVSHFWTAHFGGAFFFRTKAGPVVVAQKPELFDNMDAQIIGMDDHDALASFLFSANLVEPLLDRKSHKGAEIIQRKMDMILAHTAGAQGDADIPQDTRSLRRLARVHAGALPDVWHGLWSLHRWAMGRGEWPKITADHPAYFYSLRARPGVSADVVNRLLAAKTLLEFRQLFICHKEAFYDEYARWPDAVKDFAVRLLATEYQSDKAAVRDDLYGAWDAPEAPAPTLEQRVAAVGPWGAVRR